MSYSVYSLHRRADLYGDDAEDFRPERWQEKLGLFRDETTTRWGYLPFNGGPRQCLGSTCTMLCYMSTRALTGVIVDFAMTETAYTVVRLLQRFSVVEKPDDEVDERTGREQQTMTLVLAITNGCRVRLAN